MTVEPMRGLRQNRREGRGTATGVKLLATRLRWPRRPGVQHGRQRGFRWDPANHAASDVSRYSMISSGVGVSESRPSSIASISLKFSLKRDFCYPLQMLRQVIEVAGDDVLHWFLAGAQFLEVDFAAFDLGVFLAA